MRANLCHEIFLIVVQSVGIDTSKQIIKKWVRSKPQKFGAIQVRLKYVTLIEQSNDFQNGKYIEVILYTSYLLIGLHNNVAIYDD